MRFTLRSLLSDTPVFARLKIFVVLLIVLIVALFLGNEAYRWYLANNWESMHRNREEAVATEFQASFLAYQTESRTAIEKVFGNETLSNVLASGDSASRRSIFEILTATAPTDFSVELYDRQKGLVAWSGIRGTSVDTLLFRDSPASAVVQGPIYSYLIVVIPIHPRPDAKWYGVGKRLFDVNFPISSRFISNEIFASTFPSHIGSDIDFDFSSSAVPRSDEKVMTVALPSIDNKSIGFAYLSRPTLASSQEEIEAGFQRVIGLIVTLLLAILMWIAVALIGRVRRPIAKIAMFTIALWSFRFLLVWMNIPRVLVSASVFDSTAFASSFGFGIVRSVGDLFISSVLLLVNVGFVSSVISRHVHLPVVREGSIAFARTAWRVVVVLALAFLVCEFLRGFSTTVHSAVFDSTLIYNDPTFLFPSAELSLMLLSLGFIGAAVVIASLTIVRSALRIVSTLFSGSSRAFQYLLLFGSFAGVSVMFGAAQANPLMGQVPRLIIILCLAMAGVVFHRRPDSDFILSSWIPIPVIVVLGVGLLVPQLDTKVHELDRSHVELLTAELTHPSDTWTSVVVNQALDQLSDEAAASALMANKPEEIEKLAFTQWAKSILGREGNTCSVRFMDRGGKVVSDFHIGMTPHPGQEENVEIAPTKRHVDTEELGGKNGARWTRGYTPVMTAAGELVGGVWIEISTGKRSFLRGETPQLLTHYTREHFEAHYRKLEVSEYDNNILAASTNETFPLGRAIPPGVRESERSLWLQEAIDGRQFETYYVRDQSSGMSGSWIALSLEELDVRWHLYSYIRYGVFYLLLVGIVSLLIFGLRLLRQRRAVLTFRTKLMLAFVAVSVIPILVLAYYNREYAVEQASASALRRIQEQTSLVAAQLLRDGHVNVPASLSQLSDEQCAAVADQLDADFNVYYGNALRATSKPEVFTAELLDERLSALAYMNIYLEDRNFFSEQQSIGTLPYIVGYRPITSDNGSVIGVVSMPTLFRQSEIDEELTKRNVFLFGAYAIVLILALVVGTLFTKQFASPILLLKTMTDRVAAGDLGAQVTTSRKDEIGELERAFNAMTRNLKRSQEEMVRVQRELAWQEMARQVAHEIKNPLTPMKLSIQHLRRAYEDGVKDFGTVLRQVSTTVLGQIDALSRIASEFSQYARMPERSLTRCSVHAVVREACDLFRQHRHITLVSELAAPHDLIDADHDELVRVFINIIRNAVQAMEEKGTITITTAAAGNLLEVRIGDTGPGIPEEIQDRLFTPNFSTKTDGMGLGLTIVRKTISDLHGSVAIESVPRRGTTVVIQLPLVKA